MMKIRREENERRSFQDKTRKMKICKELLENTEQRKILKD